VDVAERLAGGCGVEVGGIGAGADSVGVATGRMQAVTRIKEKITVKIGKVFFTGLPTP
jgi:hypothetical protein